MLEEIKKIRERILNQQFYGESKLPIPVNDSYFVLELLDKFIEKHSKEEQNCKQLQSCKEERLPILKELEKHKQNTLTYECGDGCCTEYTDMVSWDDIQLAFETHSKEEQSYKAKCEELTADLYASNQIISELLEEQKHKTMWEELKEKNDNQCVYNKPRLINSWELRDIIHELEQTHLNKEVE